jgi:hypothetical protein
MLDRNFSVENKSNEDRWHRSIAEIGQRRAMTNDDDWLVAMTTTMTTTIVVVVAVVECKSYDPE